MKQQGETTLYIRKVPDQTGAITAWYRDNPDMVGYLPPLNDDDLGKILRSAKYHGSSILESEALALRSEGNMGEYVYKEGGVWKMSRDAPTYNAGMAAQRDKFRQEIARAAAGRSSELQPGAQVDSPSGSHGTEAPQSSSDGQAWNFPVPPLQVASGSSQVGAAVGGTQRTGRGAFWENPPAAAAARMQVEESETFIRRRRLHDMDDKMIKTLDKHLGSAFGR